MLKKKFIEDFSFSKNKKNIINDYIYSGYEKNISIGKLLKYKSSIVDGVVKNFWDNNNLNKKNVCLIAVGGYGRSELFPFSDIDILIIVENYNDNKIIKNIENFIADIWYLKNSVGHSVRTIEECISKINEDSVIYTNLLDSRFIIGDKKLYKKLLTNITNKNIWSKNKFLLEKKLEQETRYNKFLNTGYLLEPNIKEGPGGFRDLQTLIWIAKKKF